MRFSLPGLCVDGQNESQGGIFRQTVKVFRGYRLLGRMQVVTVWGNRIDQGASEVVKVKRCALSAVLILVVLAACVSAQEATTSPDQIAQIQLPQQPRIQIQLPRLQVPLLQLPDLTVSISGPDRAVAGSTVNLKVTVRNEGRGRAPGTNDNPAEDAYMVDMVMSQDEDVPVEFATQPTYAGYTEDDFVEDMLMFGGRISNTQSLAAGASTTYNESVPIPKNTAPGVYCLAAVVDPGTNVLEFNESNNVYCHKLLVAAPEEEDIQPPQGVDTWIMPYGVGGTRIDSIKSSGLVDYAGITDAPFGWRLGLRHGYDGDLPDGNIKYYRWLYRQQGAGSWTELTESVKVHYVKEQGGTTTFPVYALGPQGVSGMNLYEFRPHDPPSFPGATTYWPTTDWFGDIYSGFFDTRTLPDGKYEVKLEIYKPDGTQAQPGTDFEFIVPSGTTGGGTITTSPAPGAAVQGGGYVFMLHVNNRQCGAAIDPPRLGGGTLTGPCGFLLYDPGVAEGNANAQVNLSFHATHPDNFATFSFRVIRGSANAVSTSAEVTATSAGPFSGDGNGNFDNAFTRSQLLGPDCPEKAAFSLNLHVRAKATNGWSRLHRYDRHDVRAFALAPQ